MNHGHGLGRFHKNAGIFGHRAGRRVKCSGDDGGDRFRVRPVRLSFRVDTSASLTYIDRLNHAGEKGMGKRLNFKEQRTNAEYLALTMQLGLTMAGSIGLGLAIGYYLDRWLGTKGLLLIVFVLLGVIGGGITCYRQIMDLETDQKPSDRK